MSIAIELIKEERQNQIDQGYSEFHDDRLKNFELAMAADSYIMTVISPDEEGDATWMKNKWKPSDDPIRNLVKAGALIAAEIDRLQRKRIG